METATLLSIFLLGLSYGSSACLFTCMPLLSPLMLGSASQNRPAMAVLLPFSLGRISSYSFMALTAFLSAAWIKSFLEDEHIAQMMLGSTTIALALYTLFFSFRKKCAASHIPQLPGALGYYLLGIGISLSACAPVMTLIATSINAAGSLHALLLGIAFGLGAVSAMMLVYGMLVSQIAKGIVERFKAHHQWIEKGAGVLLLAVGISLFAGWIRL